MNKLTTKELHAEVEDFMDKFTNLEKGINARKSAFWLRIFTIKKAGSMLNDMVQILEDGNACFLPVIENIGGEVVKLNAIFTMGTPNMVEKKEMSRNTCPGMSNLHHGN